MSGRRATDTEFGSETHETTRAPVVWAFVGLAVVLFGLVAYRWITGGADTFVDTILLIAFAWSAGLLFTRGVARNYMLSATPSLVAILALITLVVMQAIGDPQNVRHTNALIGAYFALPISYALFFLLRPKWIALAGATLTVSIVVVLQVALPPAFAFRVTNGAWIATLTLIFHGALILLIFSVPRLRSDRDLLEAVLQSSRDAVVLFSPAPAFQTRAGRPSGVPTLRITRINNVAVERFGSVIGGDTTLGQAPATADELGRRLTEAHRLGIGTRFTIALQTVSGEAWFRVSATPFRSGLAMSLADITEHKDDAARALEMAHTDPLTGLPNRRGLEEVAAERLAVGRSPSRPLVLGFLDFDQFKSVNDRLGHKAGDELLRIVAARLTSAVRAADLVARIGGDEFVILAEHPDGDETTPFFARVLRAFDAPFNLDGHEVRLGVSMGVFVGVEDLESALAAADAAMYTAKQRGGGLEVMRHGEFG